jgi:hypothetical protein
MIPKALAGNRHFVSDEITGIKKYRQSAECHKAPILGTIGAQGWRENTLCPSGEEFIANVQTYGPSNNLSHHLDRPYPDGNKLIRYK